MSSSGKRRKSYNIALATFSFHQGKPGIVYDSQLPKGMESVKKIQEMESLWNRAPEAPLEEERVREAPVFVTKPEPVTVNEGDWARFCCRVTGHPRPRVMWLINGHTIVNVSIQLIDRGFQFDGTAAERLS